ncbi:MAG: hypothetical protein M3Y25_09960 [Thermoproteota archaeon]|nr:hypothetical protein [Thermoproteota archaeon]
MLLEPKSYEVENNAITEIVNENLISNNKFNNLFPFTIPMNYQIKINQNYNETIPSSTFYESFTQTSYYERQEINTNLNELGIHYIIVYNNYNGNNKSNSTHTSYSLPSFGKFSLAIGKVEDFSVLDFFVVIPYSWVNVKLFFNDYLSLTAGVTFLSYWLLFCRLYSSYEGKKFLVLRYS